MEDGEIEDTQSPNIQSEEQPHVKAQTCDKSVDWESGELTDDEVQLSQPAQQSSQSGPSPKLKASYEPKPEAKSQTKFEPILISSPKREVRVTPSHGSKPTVSIKRDLVNSFKGCLNAEPQPVPRRAHKGEKLQSNTIKEGRSRLVQPNPSVKSLPKKEMRTERSKKPVSRKEALCPNGKSSGKSRVTLTTKDKPLQKQRPAVNIAKDKASNKAQLKTESDPVIKRKVVSSETNVRNESTPFTQKTKTQPDQKEPKSTTTKLKQPLKRKNGSTPSSSEVKKIKKNSIEEVKAAKRKREAGQSQTNATNVQDSTQPLDNSSSATLTRKMLPSFKKYRKSDKTDEVEIQKKSPTEEPQREVTNETGFVKPSKPAATFSQEKWKKYGDISPPTLSDKSPGKSTYSLDVFSFVDVYHSYKEYKGKGYNTTHQSCVESRE
jgi:hypothetical protein